MRMTVEGKDKARAAIIDAAGRLFRERGLAGSGVDAIAQATGQTSGAFYAHFGSKADLFRDALEAGFGRLMSSMVRSYEAGNAIWARRFVQGYLSRSHRDAIGSGCLLPTLANDAARAGDTAHRLFGDMLAAAAAKLAEGCGETAEPRDERALSILALCAGGVMLARAMPEQAASDKMLKACRAAADRLATGD